jgi:hypothetical protein
MIRDSAISSRLSLRLHTGRQSFVQRADQPFGAKTVQDDARGGQNSVITGGQFSVVISRGQRVSGRTDLVRIALRLPQRPWATDAVASPLRVVTTATPFPRPLFLGPLADSILGSRYWAESIRDELGIEVTDDDNCGGTGHVTGGA